LLRLREPMDEPGKPQYRMILLRLSGRELSSTLGFLEDQWKAVAGDVPFSYQFLDDAFDELYRTEQRLSQVFAAFAGIAIFISCLGLFGMFTFAAEQRTKEIGIRKVMGASVRQIVRLLSKDFVLLIGIALVPAIPVAYFVMSRWLENFAYHIELTGGVFLIAGLTSLAIAVATVGYQAVKAAMADPVKSLRYE
ncbi:MAG: FtsX-like permease family protein, partial [Rhodothermales bacterium]